ncbi:MAG: glycosyltransferase family 2 protein [Candidatus Bathyarchaeota archaeon]|nr:glycosyltransferase family 2 protein [Candidatus Bathyarchaeota archaeon]
MITAILQGIFLFSVFVMAVYLVRHYVFTLAVLRQAKIPKVKPADFADTTYQPPVSILVPAQNEDQVIGRLLQSMAELTYPKKKLQVVVIDDASVDNTGKVAEEFSARYNFIEVLHRSVGVGGKGKAAAMNAGLTRLTGDIVLCFDADYSPRKDIVEKLVRPFADPRVGAVQGRPVVLNEPKTLVTRLVAMERMGGYRVDQEARDSLELIPQFGGTVGGFRRSVIQKLGGFDEKMLTEDTDLTFHIVLLGYKIRYVGEAECYEEAVENWRAYWKQRHRWARGHIQVCFKHSLNILRSKKLTFRQKLDGLLLLHIYFVPVITLISFFASISLMLLGASSLVTMLWFFVPISFYSFVGNFAPFFEISIGAYLDGRNRTQWLGPLLVFAFLYNLPICTKAFLDILFGKLFRRKQEWAKTSHLGQNTYVINPSVRLKKS